MWQKSKNVYHLSIAILANTFFFFPGRKLRIIGITGTDGKTTTTSLIYHILKTAGKQVSLISTVAAYIGDKAYDTGFHVTNPSSISLQKFLKQIQGLGKGKEENFLVLEVTSHGIDQNRIWGIPFAIAGLTNITHEHLDYHKTYENYVAIKARLLRSAKIAVINKDDASYELVREKLERNKQVITYGFTSSADIHLSTIPFRTNLLGDYNMYNCLLAVAICTQLGVGAKDIQNGIATFVPPVGRGEIVYPSAGSGQADFTVMIDFAHTPNAFKALLSAVRHKTKGRLIHVFGSAGKRDITKRPLMGKEAAAYDDVIILTAEDPRTEKVEEINKQIRSSIFNFQFSIFNESSNFQFTKGKKYLFEIPDRRKAIEAAIAMAKKGDFVVITGKAHEKSMNYGHGEEAWDEFGVVRKALKNIWKK